MKIRWLTILAIFISLTFLSGCWSNQELPNLALVAAIGIDKTEEGQYVTTIQVINPGNVAGEGMQGTGGSESPPVSTYTESGDNMTEINRSLSKKVSRQLYYAHTNLIVVGEKLAREEGIGNVFDALERDNEFRTSARTVIASKSKAEDIIKTLTSIDKIPSNKVIKTLRYTEKIWGEYIDVATRDILEKLVLDGENPIITCFRAVGDDKKGETLENIQETKPASRLEADGLAIFKDTRMIDTFHGDASKGVVWVLDKVKSTVVSLDWKEKKDAIVYEVVRQKTDVSAEVKGEQQAQVSVEVVVEGSIGEATVPIDLTDPHVLKDLEDLVEKEIKDTIMSSVKQVQELKTDILGFGEAVRRADPKTWKDWKHNWNDEYFPEIEVDVTVDAFIRRTGLRNQPFHMKIKDSTE